MAIKEEFENHCWQGLYSDEDYKTYAPFIRETYIGKKPAVLVIDLYNLVYKGGSHPPHEITEDFPGTCGKYAHEAIEPTVRLLESCRSAELPIYYVTGQFSENRVRSTRRKRTPLIESDYEIYDAFKPLAKDVIVRKERASSFFGTPLLAHLIQNNHDSLIVCGESTSGCVRSSVVDAYSNGFHISIVEECVFDRSEIAHKVSLFDLHHKYADVMHLSEVIEVISSR
jgi:nicotinamidase-related amidase|tara:strand:+ start:238 stop:918 length:681 start_codon:yes stop_codon:yes gene_type:complete